MKRILLMLAVVASLLLPAATLSAAYAYNPLDGACKAQNGKGKGSAACGSGTANPISGNNGILMKVSGVLATIGGVAAVIIIIVAGFRYVTSGGDPQKAAGARSAIIGAVVGLVIIAAAETIVVFVVNKL